MRKEFLIEAKPPEFYNYISGRIKILEIGLLSRETVERISSQDSVSGVKEVLSETPYRQFVKGETFSSLTESVFARFDAELSDMEKFVSQGFINSFFREKTVFLRIKKWALTGEGEEEDPLFSDLFKFVTTGAGDFPLIFREMYNEMVLRKENPLEAGILLDIYRLKFLSDSARLANSPLISDYYLKYTEKSLREILARLFGFVNSSLVDDVSLEQTLKKLGGMLSDYPLAKDLLSIGDREGFVEFVKEKIFSSESGISDSELRKVLERGRFINMGVEVVFVYLKRLQREVSELAMILSGKGNGISGKEILEKVSAAYE